MSFSVPLCPANTEVLNRLCTINPFQSFQRGQTVSCEAWRSAWKQLFRNAWSMRSIISSSHRLRARCSVGVKWQSLGVTLFGAMMIYTSQESGLKFSAKWLLLTSAAEGPGFVISALISILHQHPPWGVKEWEVYRSTDSKCWKISQKIPDTTSLGQFAEVSTDFLVVVHLHIFLPMFLLLAMYVSSF